MSVYVSVLLLVLRCGGMHTGLSRSRSLCCLNKQAYGSVANTGEFNELNTFYEASPHSVFLHGAIRKPPWTFTEATHSKKYRHAVGSSKIWMAPARTLRLITN